MRKALFLALLVVLLATSTTLAATMALSVRAVDGPAGNVYLLDNSSATAGARITVVFDRATTLEGADITVFGGGVATGFRTWGTGNIFYVSIDADVSPGANVQIALSGDSAEAVLSQALPVDGSDP